MALTTKELKQQEAERRQKEARENEKKLNEIKPEFDKQLRELCEKYKAKIETFIRHTEIGMLPALRTNPPNDKLLEEINSLCQKYNVILEPFLDYQTALRIRPAVNSPNPYNAK